MRLLVAGCMLASTVSLAAQMPLPAFSNTYTAAQTRGFYFQCPVSCVIQGIQVPNEALQPNQVVEVVDLGTSPPAVYPTLAAGTQLFYDNSMPSGTIIPCAIPLVPGNYYGILGACTPSPTSATSYNSYGAGPFTSDILGTPVQISRFICQSGIAANGGNQPVASASGSIGRVEVYIGTGSGNFASKVSFGEGCNESYASFYESHTAFDLSNTSLLLTNTGNGYLALAATTAVAPTTSTAVTMSDDQVLPFALGWTLPYPGGTTTDLWVSSNGFVNLTANTDNGCCLFDLNQFLTNGPVFAAKWDDLNPSAGGSVYFETDAVNGTATVTFDMVPDYGSSSALNTFQYYFDANGTVELRFGTVAATPGGTGWSPGLGNLDPGSIDLSATPVLLTGPNDVFPLALAADARPILGTTITLTVDNVPTGSALGAVIYGLTKHDPGIDLTSLGMPGCFQFCSQDAVALTLAPAGTSFTSAWTLPASTILAGVHVQGQGAIYDPAGGHNGLGALSSNAIDFGLDVN